MEYRLKAYSIWEFGQRVDAQGNPHQEDSIFPAHGQAKDTDRLFILCDGMGGHDAGEVASAAVCEAMSSSILSSAPDAEGPFSEELFRKALTDAYDALDEKDSSVSEKKMGTTMTLLKLHEGGCLIAHIGDSRVYHIRPGKTPSDTQVLFRTEDHSLVNDLLRAGELTPEEAKTFRRKNVITRAMQPHMERRPKADIHHITDIRPGDYFYLCSDGMLENMDDRQLCYFFSDEAGDDLNKRDSLIMSTQENRDNHSAIIVHILDVGNPLSAAPENPKPGTRRKWVLPTVIVIILLAIAAAFYLGKHAAGHEQEPVPVVAPADSTQNQAVAPAESTQNQAVTPADSVKNHKGLREFVNGLFKSSKDPIKEPADTTKNASDTTTVAVDTTKNATDTTEDAINTTEDATTPPKQ